MLARRNLRAAALTALMLLAWEMSSDVRCVRAWTVRARQTASAAPPSGVPRSRRMHAPCRSHRQNRQLQTQPTYTQKGTSTNAPDEARRHAVRQLASSAFLVGVSAALFAASPVPSAHAVEPQQPTVYITGKAPQVPGKKPQSKDDLKGTKKDPNFLRSIADCKNQCLSADTYGSSKTKEDCLSECQDVCCTTYEQCTFSIVPRI